MGIVTITVVRNMKEMEGQCKPLPRSWSCLQSWQWNSSQLYCQRLLVKHHLIYHMHLWCMHRYEYLCWCVYTGWTAPAVPPNTVTFPSPRFSWQDRSTCLSHEVTWASPRSDNAEQWFNIYLYRIIVLGEDFEFGIFRWLREYLLRAN